MVTQLQKAAAQAIVNVFETGTPRGDYANVTVAEGDAGHLTYGRSQTTLASGNLHKLIKRYCDAQGCRFGQALTPVLTRLANMDLSLDQDGTLKDLLRRAGADALGDGGGRDRRDVRAHDPQGADEAEHRAGGSGALRGLPSLGSLDGDDGADDLRGQRF